MAWGEQGTKITWKPNVVPEDQRKHGGWYDNPDTGFNTRWYSGGSTSENGGSNGFEIPAPPDMSGVYNPIYEQYGRDRELAKTNYDQNLALAGEQLTAAQTTLAKNKEQREQYKNAEQADLDNQLQSAYAQAVRTQNALQQQIRSRAGLGSSAGQAMTEIAQQEFYRQQGATQQTHLKNVGLLNADFRKYLDWSIDEELRLQREHKAMTVQLSQAYQQTLNQISANESMTRSEQARAVVQAQELYNARKADINNKLVEQRMALDQYGQKLKMDLAAQLELAEKTKYSVADNTFAQDVESTITGPQPAGVPMSTNYVSPFAYARSRYGEDEFDNPYFLS